MISLIHRKPVGLLFCVIQGSLSNILRLATEYAWTVNYKGNTADTLRRYLTDLTDDSPESLYARCAAIV